MVSLPPFQDLVDRHWRDVARLSAALVGSNDAEDCAQRAWLQALAAYPSLRSAENLRSWLLTITSHCATDLHRGRARVAIPVESLPDRPAAEAPEHDDALWDSVRALPDRQRTAVSLRYVAELPHTEIAAMLGTTPAATRRLVSDALATLRKEMS